MHLFLFPDTEFSSSWLQIIRHHICFFIGWSECLKLILWRECLQNRKLLKFALYAYLCTSLLNPLSIGACAPATQLFEYPWEAKTKGVWMQWKQVGWKAQIFIAGKRNHLMLAQSQSCCRHCRAFCLNREQQIPALRMLHAPFIKMASLPCKRTNGMEGSTLPDRVGSRAPGLGACEGLWGLPLCVVGALE